MLKVLLAGGGTAGHINPALAIAEIIKEKLTDTQFLFAGTPFGMEAKLVPKAGYNFAPIKVKGFQRKISVKNIGRNIQAAAYLATSSSRAKQIIKQFQPDLVIGTGGYVSGPVVRMAAKMGIKTAIHEQNAYPGVTTRILSKEVDKVMLTVEDAAKFMDKDIKYTVTGLPVRKGFTKSMDRNEARKILGLDDSITILSWGGSLGAGAINETVSDLIAYTQKNNLAINHIHSYGRMGKDSFKRSLVEKGVKIEGNPRLKISEYIDNMDVCTSAADIVICRCGASAIAELESMGRGSILIPSPVVAGNHQYFNGMVLNNAGAAIVVEQKDLTSEWLINEVKELCRDRKKLEELSLNAKKLCIEDTNERIFAVLSELIK